MQKADFGQDFHWGVATSAFQTEGACHMDGKGLSIWDQFSQQRGKIYDRQHANLACDFYHRYAEDIALVKALNIPNFRFSISWPRIFPQGRGHINQKGVAYYQKVIDACLEADITPWLTLYHWDLPLALSQSGGWTNRDIIGWFSDYTAECVRLFGNRVKHWMVLNEPNIFTGAGYFLGLHAPGKRWLNNYLPAIHHAAMVQAEGGRIIKSMLPEAEVGTTFSCAHIEPHRDTARDIAAAQRVDALFNRMFIEPLLGKFYPFEALKALQKIEKYVKQGDEAALAFDFDFIGIQNYTREIVKYSPLVPYIQANLVTAKERNVPTTLMGWEVYPEAMYHMLKKFHDYGIKKIMITENGAAFEDKVIGESIHDEERTNYLKANLEQALRAKNEGVNLAGYFVWTLTDNFEWAEGYRPTFGLVHVNFKSQERIIKDSGYWYQGFLQNPKS